MFLLETLRYHNTILYHMIYKNEQTVVCHQCLFSQHVGSTLRSCDLTNVRLRLHPIHT